MTLKRKLTKEEKAQILELHKQGLNGPEIADQMKIDDPRQVVGVIRAAVNFQRHPSMTPGIKSPETPMLSNTTPGVPPAEPPVVAAPVSAPPEAVQPSAPVPAPAPAPIPTPVHAAPAPRPQVARPVHMSQSNVAPTLAHAPAPAQIPAGQVAPDGFGGGWSQAPGFASGFNFNAPTRKYQVYRDEPRPDGLLGEHTDPFGEPELAKLYGQGVYRVLRFDPGNPRPFQTTVRVSANYGEPRFGNRGTNGGYAERPGYGRWREQRPWLRGAEAPREEEGVNEPAYEPRRTSMYDFARHTPAQGSDSTAAAAIKALGDLNVKALDQAEQARRQGPDSFVTKFFTEQQTQWRDQLELQRRQDEQRRKDDEERWERRQKEIDAEYKRRQEEERQRHEREVEKMRLEMEARDKAREQERKMLMDLEDKKLSVIRDEHKMRQEALQAELARNREDQKLREERLEKQINEIQSATAAQIQEHEEKFKAEMTREREQLEREQKLKEKHLDKEHELQSKILDVKKEQLESQGTNEVFQVVNNLINKFSSGLKEVVDLKKIEAMAPEAQAAAVQRGTINMGGKDKEDTVVEPSKPAAAAAGAEAKSAGGNGPAAPEAAVQQEERPMEEIVQQMVEQPFFQQVLKEWAIHVRTKQDATTFVNMYLEWMRDPQDHEGRKATTMFANFIAPRPWAELYKILKPKLKPEIVVVFDTPDAAEYYETFRSLVTEQIAAYWEQFAQDREAQKAARRAAGNGAHKPEEAAKK